MDANSGSLASTGSEPSSVEVAGADVPGAALDEPLDRHNVAALRWWLQCHGIKPVPSWKKQQLISSFTHALLALLIQAVLGEAKCLPRVRSGVLDASALGKCLLHTRWWSFTLFSSILSAFSHCFLRVWPLGKRCIDTLRSLARLFPQTTHTSPGIATIDGTQQRQTGL